MNSFKIERQGTIKQNFVDFGSVDSGRKAFTYLMDFERLRLEQIERKGQKYVCESLGFEMQSKLYMRD